MADSYYKLVSGDNAVTDWTSEVVLEKDDAGNVTKSIAVDRPAQLSKKEIETVKALGYDVETSSKDEAVEAAIESATGGDVQQAPSLGSGDKNDK